MTLETTDNTLNVRDLGRLRYAEVLTIQRQVNQRVIDGDAPPTLLLVEHEPVITITPRRGAAEHLLATPKRLAALGIEVCETDRGGDITYHGPGQLVAYPILKLQPLNLNLSRYMRRLEQIVIQTAGHFGVEASVIKGQTGVWVQGDTDATPPQKLCALGVRIRRNVTMHGLALNVSTNLSHFETIQPCGLTNRAVTSFAALLGEQAPTMGAVKAVLIRAFEKEVTG